MKTGKYIKPLTVSALLIISGCLSPQRQMHQLKENATESYTAVEIDNVLCGYSHDRERLVTENGKQILYQEADVKLLLTLLGQGVNIRFDIQFKLDPQTGRWFYNRTTIDNGSASLDVRTEIIGDTAYFQTNQGNMKSKIFLPAGTELESTQSYPHLVRDFIKAGKTDSLYRVLDFLTGGIIDKRYVKKGEEDLLLNDSLYHSIILEETDITKGTKSSIWLETASGFPLKQMIAGRNIYLTDESVIGRITEGSQDSWEAAKKLSHWVSQNIKGAIPGGATAINTYRTREGECGSHSRLLAAFCRAVGIPARLSIGCFYTTHNQGSFGQHAWTEIFMGAAGWIPVDATAHETDNIDAGHIRLGESSLFMPREMEILEYRTASVKQNINQ